MFADDTKHIELIHNATDCVPLQNDIYHTVQWSSSCDLDFNIAKFIHMSYWNNLSNSDWDLTKDKYNFILVMIQFVWNVLLIKPKILYALAMIMSMCGDQLRVGVKMIPRSLHWFASVIFWWLIWYDNVLFTVVEVKSHQGYSFTRTSTT